MGSVPILDVASAIRCSFQRSIPRKESGTERPEGSRNRLSVPALRSTGTARFARGFAVIVPDRSKRVERL